MRRNLVLLGLLLTLALSPTLAYEGLEKTAETVGPYGTLLRLSYRAEVETRWRNHTGVRLLDHALHELQETHRFYRLAQRRLRAE